MEQAGDGREALAKAIAEPPDVIVMEATLPGITGYDLCQLLRKDRDTSTVPILVVTADADPQTHQRLHAAGADVVLSKPCAPTVLVSHVDEAIEQAGARLTGLGVPPGSSNVAHQQRMSHALRRYETTTPPAAPPPLLCPACLDVLEFQRSFVGGVTHKFQEQWDELSCRHCCGEFQYRHRTRKLSRVSIPSSDR